MRLNLLPLIFILLLAVGTVEGKHRGVVVVDSTSMTPLPNPTIFDRFGNPVGMGNYKGRIPVLSSELYPITISYLGFRDKVVHMESPDTILMQEVVSELPEFVVEIGRRRILHILGYIREYSTLTTYTDTVFLFREKTVDFMLPSDGKSNFKGWSRPRVLTSKSYYRFTNSDGLDSVSDNSPHHFSWSDWVGITSGSRIPSKLTDLASGRDTIMGPYSPAEIWRREGDKISVDVDVLADTKNRKWVTDLSGFFKKDLAFENFKVRYEYDNVVGDSLLRTDLAGYSFDIESTGRGHGMFRFNRYYEPFFVNTHGEVYITDKEYITLREAKKWESGKLNIDDIGIIMPMNTPPVSEDIELLVERVENIDQDEAKLGYRPDYRLVTVHDGRYNFRIGQRALNMLKGATGISRFRHKKNMKRNWREFRHDRVAKNKIIDLTTKGKEQSQGLSESCEY